MLIGCLVPATIVPGWLCCRLTETAISSSCCPAFPQQAPKLKLQQPLMTPFLLLTRMALHKGGTAGPADRWCCSKAGNLPLILLQPETDWYMAHMDTKSQLCVNRLVYARVLWGGGECYKCMLQVDTFTAGRYSPHEPTPPSGTSLRDLRHSQHSPADQPQRGTADMTTQLKCHTHFV